MNYAGQILSGPAATLGKILKCLVVVTALSIASADLLAQSSSSSSQKPDASNKTDDKGKGGGNPGDPAGKGQPNKGQPPKAGAPDQEFETPALVISPDQIKKIVEDFKAAQSKFLAEQKKLQQQLQSAGADAREKIREQMKEKREVFLEQHKLIREEIQKRVADLRDQLKDHKDLVDEAKEEAKDKARQRRGGAE
jgi:hypothetical protein